MTLFLVLTTVLAVSDAELAVANEACAVNVYACDHRDALEAQRRAEYEVQARKELARLDAEREKSLAEVRRSNAADAAAEDAIKKKCGADFGRVRVGMKFSRVLQCSGDGEDEFEVVAEDERGTVYEAPSGFVRVEHGRVTRWIVRP